MRWPRRLSMLGLALLLAVGVSCTSSDSALTGPAEGPAAAPVEQQPSHLLGGIGDLAGGLTGTLVGTLGKVTDLLTCSPQPYASTTKAIGPMGGVIPVGDHWLVIPRGALNQKVTIRAEQMPGSTNSVRFSPDELKFERPAILTMTYKNCLLVLVQKRIVYTTEELQVIKPLRSLDLFKTRTVSAPIDHFSRYAVAY